jgi:hypothetical protein
LGVLATFRGLGVLAVVLSGACCGCGCVSGCGLVTGCGLVHPGGRLVTGGGLVTGGVRKRVTGRGVVSHCGSGGSSSCVIGCEGACCRMIGFLFLRKAWADTTRQYQTHTDVVLDRRRKNDLHNLCKSPHQN